MKKYFTLIVIILAGAIQIFSQVIPPERRGDWIHAGYSDSQRYIPRFPVTKDVKTQLGGRCLKGDGINDDSQNLQAVIDSISGPVTYIFPAGTYLFNNTININGKNSIVLRGGGSDQTVFYFDCAWTTVGNLITITQSHDIGIENLKIMRNWNFDLWAFGLIRAFYVNMDQSCNILFGGCYGCWVYGVESVKPVLDHIHISGGSHIVVKGCYLNDVYDNGQCYIGGDHTHGYGVVISGGHCLVEDNICKHLRHGIAFSGFESDSSVAGYNYVRDGYGCNDDPNIGTKCGKEWDILCHGHSNNFNLFEGNVVDLLGADNRGDGSHDNTFFRNIAYDAQDLIFDEGNSFWVNIPNLNVVGNVFTKDNKINLPGGLLPGFLYPPGIIDIYGVRDNVYRTHFEHGLVNDCGDWNNGTNPCEREFSLAYYSYYYTSEKLAPFKVYNGESPDFWDPSITWPAIGPPYKYPVLCSQVNPAKRRWDSGAKLTVDAPPLEPCFITLSPAQYIEPDRSIGTYVDVTYKINNINKGTSVTEEVPYGQPLTIEAVAPNATLYAWSDGSVENPRVIKPKSLTTTLYATFRCFRITLDSAIYAEPGTGGTYTVGGTNVGTSWSGHVGEGHSITLGANPPNNFAFACWSDANYTCLNPWTYEPPDNVTLTAEYKMHLKSSTINATNGNAGRKIAYGLTLHTVYCSGGSIWYTRQNSDGSWTPEVKLSDGRNPSITVTNLDDVHVVWENYSGVSQSRVYYRRSSDGGVNWEMTKEFTGLEINGGYDATPVVFGNYGAAVVWRYGQEGNGGLYAVFEPNGTNMQNQIVSDWNAQLPSGAEIGYQTPTGAPDGPPYQYHLVYKDGSGATIYNRLNVYSPPLYLSATATLSTAPSPTSGNTNPSVACDALGTTVAAAWENTTNHRVYYRESTNDGSSWGTVKEFTHGTEALSQPTVCMNSRTTLILFQCGGQVGRVRKEHGDPVWSPIIHINRGNGPQMPSFYQTDFDIDPTFALWTSGSSAPYRIDTKQVFASQEVSGTISSDATWSNVVTVTGTVTVDAGVTLTITPGSYITFSGVGTSLIVNGVLNAQGTDTEPIQFTSASGATKGSWNSIKVQNGNSIFKYCTIENASMGLYLYNATAGNRTTVENCIFQNNINGVYAYNSKVTIKCCEFVNNNYGVWCYTTSDVKLIGNRIHNNVYQGIHTYTGNLVQLYGNVIESNGQYGLWTASSDVVRLGQPYSWEGFNTIRGNGSTELYAYSGSPTVTIVTGSIHDASGLEIYSYSNNPQINTNNCYWDANGCQYSGNVSFNGSNNSLPSWDGQTRTSGSPLGKVIASQPTDGISSEMNSSISEAENISKYKEIISGKTDAKEKKNALELLYSTIRADYVENELGEKEVFFNYLQGLRVKYSGSGTGELALRYMIIWKMLENDPASVISYSKQALNVMTGEVKKWILADLANTYMHSGKMQEANGVIQTLKKEFSDDKDLIADIENNFAYMSEQLTNGENNSFWSTKEIPTEFGLSQNYPNPFNPTTTISYQLKASSIVTLRIYDILGREVANLVDGMKEAGYYTATFDGSRLSSGIYFMRFVAQPQEGDRQPFVQVKKMIMMK